MKATQYPCRDDMLSAIAASILCCPFDDTGAVEDEEEEEEVFVGFFACQKLRARTHRVRQREHNPPQRYSCLPPRRVQPHAVSRESGHKAGYGERRTPPPPSTLLSVVGRNSLTLRHCGSGAYIFFCLALSVAPLDTRPDIDTNHRPIGHQHSATLCRCSASFSQVFVYFHLRLQQQQIKSLCV